MNYYKFIILTFIITGLWDVILRIISNNSIQVRKYLPFNLPQFITDLKPYFNHHTILSAGLIAGFVGATTQTIILYFMNFPLNNNVVYNIKFMMLSFIISALYGFVMKWSKLFPYLDKYYYDKLGTVKSVYHDGISGLIVQFSLLILLKIIK